MALRPVVVGLMAWALVGGCRKQEGPAAVPARAPATDGPGCASFVACQRGCEAGVATACVAAAGSAFSGSGTPRDLAVGWALTWRACDLGHVVACARVGLAPSAHLPADAWVDVSSARARALSGLPGACAAGDAEACELAATYQPDAGYGPKAVAALRSGCEGHRAEACNRLGNALLDGDLGVSDVGAGRAALEGACERGLAGACASLGLRLLQGRGVEVDQARAKALLHRAGQLSADAGR